MKLTAVILTRNEAQHLPRCLESLAGVADEVLVVDAFSTDESVELASKLGAQVVQRAWVSYANQFNWALGHIDASVDWILRFDADEYLSPELAREIREVLPGLGEDIGGVRLPRRLVFQGRPIRFGGVYPNFTLRLFRNGRGSCENRWLNENILVEGRTVDFRSALVDENLEALSQWTEKYNLYSNREAVDLLNLEFGFMEQDSLAVVRGSRTFLRRWLIENAYLRLPGGLRAFLYFLYRYLLRLGFLDGRAGMTYHFLQGFWYRYLVDAKVVEVKTHILNHQCDVETSINEVLGIRVWRLRNTQGDV